MNKNLQKLGSFTLNDSRIYTTLLLFGLSSPAKISEKSQVDRARVYDSLKRLVKRGIVEEEPVPRAPRYRAVPPEIVFGKLISKFKNKIGLAEHLVQDLENLTKFQPIEINSVWTVQGEKKIRKLIRKFIEEAEEYCFLILTLDYSNVALREFEAITQWILEKLQKSNAEFRISMKISKDEKQFTPLINHLYHEGVKFYNWNSSPIIPFGLVITEKAYVQTYLSSSVPKPTYGYGVFMENASKSQIKGLYTLSMWVFTHLCQQVIFAKKNQTKTGD
ncbi:MAG: hypothetical protein K9W44_16640 [Candidatus Lokiarchaeota archaeon]|nr:hypothetical protein [Candidatus Harpocratesius repetitus]